MVRRGSTVRVRQRALQKPCTASFFFRLNLHGLQLAVGMGALHGAFRSKSAPSRDGPRRPLGFCGHRPRAFRAARGHACRHGASGPPRRCRGSLLVAVLETSRGSASTRWEMACDTYAEVAALQCERFRARVVRPLQRSLVNPVVKSAWRLGLGPPGDALLETTGRRTGRPRLTPICDGQDGDTFWVVTQRGRRSDYVRNIQANPRVRVKVRRGARTEWLAGTAHIVDADDPRERQRIIARGNLWRRICVQASGAMSTSLLTLRIDLDSR